MLTSILLSFQSLRMAKDNVLVRKINGLETAGSLSILFSDKTGTIVNNSAVAGDGAIIGGNSTDRALMAFLVSSGAADSMSKDDVKSFNAFDSSVCQYKCSKLL